MLENNSNIKPKFCPKAVAELIDGKHTFSIPSFQRGYRWGKKQVTDLLNDIRTFVRTEGSNTYYLQPLVVIKKCSGNQPDENCKESWSVLDGQQRLTTIRLIIAALVDYMPRKKADSIPNNLYALIYDNRQDLDFDNPDETKNMDSFYVFNAKKTIEEWIVDKLKNGDDSIFDEMARSMVSTDYSKKVKFIWYEASSNPDSQKNELEAIEIFNRLNNGKVSLTSSELIKALLILSAEKTKGNDTSLYLDKLALEWSEMEKQFEDDSFWYFITNKGKNIQTRIDVLFDFWAEKPKDADDDFAYRHCQEIFDDLIIEKKSDSHGYKSMDDVWIKIKECYNMMLLWFNDAKLYNYIGYLVQFGSAVQDINSKIIESRNKLDKPDEWDIFKTQESLSKLIKDIIKSKNSKIQDAQSINAIYYSNSNMDIIRKLLLLYNVEIYSNSGLKFPFHKFKEENWDVEHVDSQTTNTLQDINDKIQWMCYAIDTLKLYPQIDGSGEPTDANKLLTDAEKLKTNLESSKKDENKSFDTFYSKFVKFQSNLPSSTNIADIDKDSLGNLVLLDSKTNRGYQNAPFPYKRACIIENDKIGKFVPMGTKNVFLKYYTDSSTSNVIDNFRWNDVDKYSYLENIHQTIDNYLND